MMDLPKQEILLLQGQSKINYRNLMSSQSDSVRVRPGPRGGAGRGDGCLRRGAGRQLP